MHPAIYRMSVIHQRLHPERHGLRTRITALLLDLDELDAVSSTCRLFSVDRANLVSFHRSDHAGGVGEEEPRAWVAARCRETGAPPPEGRLLLLAMPRLLGRCFNPISVFLAYGCDGRLATVVYAVRNTFGGRHAYVVPVAAGDGPLRHAAEKCFHVSPFQPPAMGYRFVLSLPEPDGKGDDANRFRLRVDGVAQTSSEILISTVMDGRAAPLTDRALLAAALHSPFQGLRVLGEIHLHALLLWWKGARFRTAGDEARNLSASAGC